MIDLNQRCNFSTLASQQWLAIRLQMMGVVMVAGVAFTAVLERLYGGQSGGSFLEFVADNNLSLKAKIEFGLMAKKVGL